jgi:hypothetical protein
VHVLLLEVGSGLHLDERASGRVPHDADAVPARRVAEQLVLDVAGEHDLAPMSASTSSGA